MELSDIEKVGRVLIEKTHLNRIFWLENNLFKSRDGKVVKVITVRKIINRKDGGKFVSETNSFGVSVENSGNFMDVFKKHQDMWSELDGIEITPVDVDVLNQTAHSKRANLKLPEKYIKGKEKEFKKRQDNAFVSDEHDGEKETSFIRAIERQFTKKNEVEIKAKDRNEINKKDREDGLKGGF